jgi:hypothetical protein
LQVLNANQNTFLDAKKVCSVSIIIISVMAGSNVGREVKTRILTFANPEMLSLKEQSVNVLKHIVLITYQSKYLPPIVTHI